MIAPNGARRTTRDHPALPVTLEALIATATECFAAGADGIHLHLRDADQRHILDAGLYREAVQALHDALPDMAVQITTEAVGLYASDHQRAVGLASGATLISASIREIMTDTDPAVAAGFYEECAANGIAVQHILYDVADFDLLRQTLPPSLFADEALQLLYVLGRYAQNQQSTPGDLRAFTDAAHDARIAPDWGNCAFGAAETDCLVAAHKMGGKMRVGFENSLWNSDGSLAASNAERVEELLRALQFGG